MIISKIKASRGYSVICTCDLCGKEIKRSGYLIERSNNHFCSSDCKRGYISKTCIICGKPFDNTFYDKSEYRPLCSKECYSVHFDNWYKDFVMWGRYEADRKKSKLATI